jgi:hypothetical protein
LTTVKETLTSFEQDTERELKMGLEALEKRKASCSCPIYNPDSISVEPTA